MSEKVLNQFCRNDDFNPSVDFSNSIQEKWIHKKVVVRTGDGEDDWIVEEKPVLVDKIDLHKCINEEAKTTDLKYLLKQLLISGDESILNQKQGFYGDVTAIQSAVESGQSIVTPEQVKNSLPEEFKELSSEQLALMSDEEILSYYQAKVNSKEIKEQPKVDEQSKDGK